MLWNLQFYYRIYKRSPPVPVLSQSNPVHEFPSHFLQIHFNIILPSTPRQSKWSPSLGSLHQNSLYTSALPYHTPRPSHSSRFYHSNKYLKRRTNHKAPHYVVFSSPCYVFSLKPKYLPQHPLLEYLSLYFPTLWETKLCTHTVEYARLQFCISWYSYVWIANSNTKDSEPNDAKLSLTSVRS